MIQQLAFLLFYYKSPRLLQKPCNSLFKFLERSLACVLEIILFLFIWVSCIFCLSLQYTIFLLSSGRDENTCALFLYYFALFWYECYRISFCALYLFRGRVVGVCAFYSLFSVGSLGLSACVRISFSTFFFKLLLFFLLAYRLTSPFFTPILRGYIILW